ncbi:MAG TPA: molybdate ABC transporter substrate-binding protein [Pyrinomonadaceae bacterium]|nr:molybdate ABC transporter substrate-binding protein [Pyrinomonadaceae bacterium]
MRGFKYLWLACVLLATVSCGRQASPESSKQPELVVAAAANLTEAFEEIGRRFTSQTGIRVVFSFGATADLAKQIENGAPFDVFASADTEHVDRLERQGLLTPGTRAIYARGRLVAWLPPGSKLTLARVEDITAANFERIAIAKPDVAPYGKATIEALRALKIWTEVEPKIVYAQNVSQAKQYAATGNAEVAFIPLALVKIGEGSFVELNQDLHQPIDQALAVIKASQNQDAAKKFAVFVVNPEVQSLLVNRGYFLPNQ